MQRSVAVHVPGLQQLLRRAHSQQQLQHVVVAGPCQQRRHAVGILGCDVSSCLLSGMLSGMLPGLLPGLLPGMLSGMLAGALQP